MKWIFLLLTLISIASYGQTDDSSKYIWYKFQYGSRMPRNMADSVGHMPYLDTMQLISDGVKARPGAIVMRPQDKLFYQWDGDKWGLLGGNSIDTTSLSNRINTKADQQALVDSSALRFRQGGNSFGAEAVIGTNDANALSLETNALTRMSISSGSGLIGINTAPLSGYQLRVRGLPIRLSSLLIDSQGVFAGNRAGISLYGRPAVMTGYTYGIMEESFPTISAPGWYGYLGIRSAAYIYSPTPQQPGTQGKFGNYMIAFASGQVYDNDNTTMNAAGGFVSTINNQHGTITSAYDFRASEINTINATTNNDSVSNHYAFYSEPFVYGVGGTKNYGVYINGIQNNYFGGKVWIGSKTDTMHLLNVGGSMKIRKDSVPVVSSVTSEDILLLDTNGTNQVKRIKVSDLPAGTPALTESQIAYGSSGNFQTSSTDLRYIDSVKAVISEKFLAGNYIRSGDSAYNTSASKYAVFFGNSITAGSITPTYLRYSTRTAAALNDLELNNGIGGTTLVQLSAGDSSLQDRWYMLPMYNSSIHDRIFLDYGANDCGNGSIDSGTYRTIYERSLDTIITARGWPADKVTVIGISYIATGAPLVVARDTMFNRITREVAELKGVEFVDVRASMIALGGTNLLQTDKIHPTEYGHEIMALQIADSLHLRAGTARVTGYFQSGPLVAKSAGDKIPSLSLKDTSGNTFLEVRGRYSSSASTWFAIGNSALGLNSGANNYAIGDSSQALNTTGVGNVSFGHQTLSRSNGTNNTALGHLALKVNSTGNENVAIGRLALSSNTTGAGNVAIGSQTLIAATTVGGNVAIGFRALNATTAANNVAIGNDAVRLTTTGNNNVGVGFEALSNNTTGNQSVAFGGRALKFATTGGKNTAFGYNSLDSVTTGTENTALGHESGFNQQVGDRNVYVGIRSALGNRRGSANVVLGSYTFPTADSSASNRLAVADGDGNLFLYGNASQNIGIGTVTPTERLEVSGRVKIQTVETGSVNDSIAVINNGVIKRD